ncbi:MAG: phenylalanine--tRNA ligase subunit beta [archaeon]
MPTIEISLKDFNKLMKKNFSLKELKEGLFFVKGEVDAVEEDSIKVDLKDTNRADLWSTEGIARELKGQYGIEKGLPKYKVKKSGRKALIDSKLKDIRPKGAYAVVKGVKVTEEFIVQLIQLQEKICENFGRKRKEIAIGLFDLDKVKGNVRYYAAPASMEFVPLGFSERMSLREILLKHPKGKDYGNLIEKFEEFPLLVDSGNEVLSMPPIINSEGSGKVTTTTKNLFVDVTGFNQELIDTALKVVCMALADRGGSIESVELNYGKKKLTSPVFGEKKIVIDLREVNSVLGMNLKAKEAVKLLEKKRMNGKVKGNKIEVSYPDYRMDIIHPMDVIEDIAVAFDYNKMIPEKVKLFTVGKGLEEEKKLEEVRELCIGFGLQEVITFNLSSKEIQEEKMNLRNAEFVEIANPISSNWEVFRLSIIPELLNFLGRNKLYSYPQRIFEVGKTVELSKGTETGVKEKNKLCIVMSHSKANFNEMKSVLEAIALNLGLKYSLKEAVVPFLVDGRTALINSGERKGVIGEVNQNTLDKFGLENKVSVLELEL